jgi:hypothetical protein
VLFADAKSTTHPRDLRCSVSGNQMDVALVRAIKAKLVLNSKSAGDAEPEVKKFRSDGAPAAGTGESACPPAPPSGATGGPGTASSHNAGRSGGNTQAAGGVGRERTLSGAEARPQTEARRRSAMGAAVTRLSHRLSRALGLSEAPPDNHIVRFHGVSLRSLKELRERIEQEKEAVAVEVYKLKTSAVARCGKTVQVGSSVRLVSRISDETLLCHAPYVGLVEVNVANADKKKRTEWSTEDVAEYLVKTRTQAFNGFYLDILPPADVGERFQGTFVSQARAMRFGDLIDGLLEHFQEAQADLRTTFVWLDLFSANQPLLTDSGVASDIKRARADRQPRALLQLMGRPATTPSRVVCLGDLRRNEEW